MCLSTDDPLKPAGEASQLPELMDWFLALESFASENMNICPRARGARCTDRNMIGFDKF